MDPDIIQRFLESVGQKADVDLYLKLFRSQRKESFAIIAADAQIVRAALDPFHFDLRILAGLGLYPVVLVGLLDARDADKQSQRILEWLLEDEVPAKVIGSGTDLPQEIQTSRAPDLRREHHPHRVARRRQGARHRRPLPPAAHSGGQPGNAQGDLPVDQLGHRARGRAAASRSSTCPPTTSACWPRPTCRAATPRSSGT